MLHGHRLRHVVGDDEHDAPVRDLGHGEARQVGQGGAVVEAGGEGRAHFGQEGGAPARGLRLRARDLLADELGALVFSRLAAGDVLHRAHQAGGPSAPGITLPKA